MMMTAVITPAAFAPPAPTEWSATLVMQRLLEAYAIEMRMPAERFTAIQRSWPVTPLHDFTDRLHWQDPRERVWAAFAHAKGVHSWEVSRMDEAIDWLQLLHQDDRKYLMIWGMARTRRRPLRRVLRMQGYPPASFYRKVKRCAQNIADRLNERRVQVR